MHTRKQAYEIEKKYFADIGKLKVGLTKEEEGRLAAQAKTDPCARNAMIEANLRLVPAMIKKFPRPYSPPDRMDLIQEGNVGLCESVALSKRDRKGETRYDPKSGRFTTHAASWIKHSIYRHLNTGMSATSIPYNPRWKIRKAIKLRQDYIGEHDQKPADRWMIKRLKKIYGKKITDKEAKKVLKMSDCFRDSALKTKRCEVNDEVLYHAAHAQHRYSDEYLNQSYPQAMQHHDLEKMLKILTPREEQIVRARFGLEDFMTLKELARSFHVTRERIRQIGNKALQKLKVYALDDLEKIAEFGQHSEPMQE